MSTSRNTWSFCSKRKPALGGMIATALKYSKVDGLTEYISKQVKFKESFKRIVRNQVVEY